MTATPLQILLVDHHEIDLYIAQRNLEKAFRQAEICTFPDSQVAIEFFKTQAAPGFQGNRFLPDLILVEIHMPVLNGPEFLRSLYKLDGAYKKNRAYLTHATYADRMETNVSAGWAGFIQKPLTPERIREILQDFPTCTQQ